MRRFRAHPFCHWWPLLIWAVLIVFFTLPGLASLTYGDNGLLNIRENLWRRAEVLARDGRGRPLDIYSTVHGNQVMRENNLAWAADSRLNQYQLQTGGPRGNETRQYGYQAQRGFLTSETLKLDAGQSVSVLTAFTTRLRSNP